MHRQTIRKELKDAKSRVVQHPQTSDRDLSPYRCPIDILQLEVRVKHYELEHRKVTASGAAGEMGRVWWRQGEMGVEKLSAR